MEVVRAALAWWLTKRPRHWDLYQHLASPTIGCRTGEEIELARACASFEQQRIFDAMSAVEEAERLAAEAAAQQKE